MPTLLYKFEYASYAEDWEHWLGDDYYIADGAHGRGLFANKRFERGDVICAYDGRMLDVVDARKLKVKTHVMRLAGTQFAVDGWPLARALRFDPADGKWWPEDPEEYELGWAFMANSSAGTGDANARTLSLIDDRAVRRADYDPELQTPLPKAMRDILPRRAYLVAEKTIRKGEEILWYYNPA